METLDEYLIGCLPDSPERLHQQIQADENLARIARDLTRWREVRPWLRLSQADEEAIAHNYRTVERQRSVIFRAGILTEQWI